MISTQGLLCLSQNLQYNMHNNSVQYNAIFDCLVTSHIVNYCPSEPLGPIK